MDCERLRPLLKKLGGHLKKNKGFFEELRLGFSNVITTLDEFQKSLPNIMAIYVSEVLTEDERVIYNNYIYILGKKLDPEKDQVYLEIRMQYKKQLSKQITQVKAILHSMLFPKSYNELVEKNVIEEEVEVENNDDEDTDDDQDQENAVLIASNKTLENLFPLKSSKNSSTNRVCADKSRVLGGESSRSSTRVKEKFNKEMMSTATLKAAAIAALSTSQGVQPASRSLTNILPKPAEMSVEKESRQSLKRKRKRYIKKLLQSVLNFRNTKQIKQSHYYAYVNKKLNNYDAEKTTTYFEKEGFLAFSMVKDLRAITQEEREVIEVFETIRKRYTKELTENKERRLINQPSGGIHVTNYTSQDNLRRAVSITFGPAVKSLQILVDFYVQQFIHLGLVHPDTKAGNALGKMGIELLFKGSGLNEQVPHYDFPNFKDSNIFLSYRQAMSLQPTLLPKLKFKEHLDGGCSLFVNHTDKEDTLSRPDGKIIVIPPYSYCILRGNVAHYGTGNSEDDAIFKFFCYLDPVKYFRATNPYKESVFLFNEYRHIVRSKQHPHAVVLNSAILPYYCIYCNEENYYTYPMCTVCLSKNWRLKMSVDKTTNRFLCVNAGEGPINKGHVFPDPFKKGFMTKEQFARKYPELGGEKVGQISASDSHVQDLLSYKSFLSNVKMQITGFNVVLEYDLCDKVGRLKVVKDIEEEEELIVKAEPCSESEHFIVDIDEYALNAAINGESQASVVHFASHTISSQLDQLEINGDDGKEYDEDEEFEEEVDQSEEEDTSVDEQD